MSPFRQIGAHRGDAQRSTGSPNEAINNVKRSSTTSTAMRLPSSIQQSPLKMRLITACTSMRNLEQAQTSSMTSRDRTSDWRSDRPALSPHPLRASALAPGLPDPVHAAAPRPHKPWERLRLR